MEISVTFDPTLEQAQNAFEVLGAEFREEVMIAIQKSLDETRRDAKSIVKEYAYDTGELYNSISSILYDSGRGFVYVDDRKYYNSGKKDISVIMKRQVVEWGRKEYTNNWGALVPAMPDRSFIRDAGDANYDKNKRRIARAVTKVIKKFNIKTGKRARRSPIRR